MLLNCPECELQVSDKAATCPHCGYPLDSKKVLPKSSTGKNRKRRLPNGFGRITELRGQNLRKPFRAMVTTGKGMHGEPIAQLLKPEAYFKTYNEAYEALVNYHRNPYDSSKDLTVDQVHDRWKDAYCKSHGEDNYNKYQAHLWNYCGSIKGMYMRDVRPRHIRGVIDDGIANINGVPKYASPNTRLRIKTMFNQMFDYALELEIVDKNYARSVNITGDIYKEIEESTIHHLAFTDDEMKILWDNLGKVDYVDLILLQCYSGWRPQELVKLELKNINLEDMTMTGGMKTKAGRGRVVPIHSKVMPIVKDLYQISEKIGNPYLVTSHNSRARKDYTMSYEKYRYRFDQIIEDLGLSSEHRPHDPRKQFITMCKEHGVDEYAIKYFVGHSIDDITEKIYTARKPEWFVQEISKIP